MNQNTMKTQPGRSVAVLGAGIVGSAVALALSAEGHRVQLFDRADIGAGASYGNAGGIVTGAVTPTATPAIIRSMPTYLFDPNSAAVLRPRHSLRVLPWLMRFIAAGRPSRVAQISAALAPLLSRSMPAHRALSALGNGDELIQPVGWLKVYATEAGFERAALERRLMREHGVHFSILDAHEVAELEPNLNRALLHRGVFQPECGFVNFPMALAQAYFESARQRGARFTHAEVERIEPLAGGGVSLTTGEGVLAFDAVVVAAGAWSKRFARQIGDSVVLDTERGYHLSFGPSAGGLLRRPVVFPERTFVLSPMHDGTCLFSGDELAGMDALPDYRRIRALVPKAREVLPGLDASQVEREWMGRRPSTPDSLPVIGRSPRCRDVCYAFGHGHLGLTLAAISAQLVAGIMRDVPEPFDLTPYRIARF